MIRYQIAIGTNCKCASPEKTDCPFKPGAALRVINMYTM